MKRTMATIPLSWNKTRPAPVKTHALDGVPGLAGRQHSRKVDAVISVYHTKQAGFTNAETWTLVCEAHGSRTGVATMTEANALRWDTTGWCEGCAEKTGGRS